MRRTRWLILCVLAMLTLVPGCGGCAGRERGKNSDFDRPKHADDRPAEKK